MTATVGDAMVADAMLLRPKVLPADATVAEVEGFFGASDHVHLAVVVDASDRVLTTITLADLAPADRAVDLGTLEGRLVSPDASLDEVWSRMVRSGIRRLVAVDDDGRLIGLLCLKRHHGGFCSDDDVRCRQAERA